MSLSHRACPWYREVITHPDLKRSVQNAVEALRGVDFDAIVFTGVSGALFGPVLAYQLGKEIVVVRKPGHNRGYICEGFKDAERYIFVDDMIDTGKTIVRVIKEMRGFALHGEIIGAYLYHDDGFVSIEKLEEKMWLGDV